MDSGSGTAEERLKAIEYLEKRLGVASGGSWNDALALQEGAKRPADGPPAGRPGKAPCRGASSRVSCTCRRTRPQSPPLALLNLLSSACSPPPALLSACSPQPALLRLLSSALPRLLSSACSPLPALLSACSPIRLLSSACSPPPAIFCLLFFAATCRRGAAFCRGHFDLTLLPGPGPTPGQGPRRKLTSKLYMLSHTAPISGDGEPWGALSACSLPLALLRLLSSSACSPRPALLGLLSYPPALLSACSPPPALLRLLFSACSLSQPLAVVAPPSVVGTSTSHSSQAQGSRQGTAPRRKLTSKLYMLSHTAPISGDGEPWGALLSACSPPPALLRLLSSFALLSACSPPPALLRLLSSFALLSACSPPPALLRLLSSACSPLRLLSSTCSPPPALLSACSPRPALLCLHSSPPALLNLLSSACSPPPAIFCLLFFAATCRRGAAFSRGHFDPHTPPRPRAHARARPPPQAHQ